MIGIPLSAFQKRDRIVSSPNIPKYATPCSGAVRYASACACVGVFPTNVTITRPAVTTMVHTTVWSTTTLVDTTILQEPVRTIDETATQTVTASTSTVQVASAIDTISPAFQLVVLNGSYAGYTAEWSPPSTTSLVITNTPINSDAQALFHLDWASGNVLANFDTSASGGQYIAYLPNLSDCSIVQGFAGATNLACSLSDIDQTLQCTGPDGERLDFLTCTDFLVLSVIPSNDPILRGQQVDCNGAQCEVVGIQAQFMAP